MAKISSAKIPGAKIPSAKIPTAELAISSGMQGRFGTPHCTADRNLEATGLALYGPALRAMAEERNLAQEKTQPLLYDTGGLLGPDGVARYAAAHDPRGLARWVKHLGYRALAFGETELGLPRAQLNAVARELRVLGIPLVATNLRCQNDARTLCEAIVDADDGVPLFAVRQQRIAVVHLVAQRLLSHASARQRKAIELLPLESSLAWAVGQARQAGATLVVASVDYGDDTEHTSSMLQLLKRLPSRDKPDLMIASGGNEDLLFARPVDFSPPVVAAPQGGLLRLNLDRDRFVDSFTVLAVPMRAAKEPTPTTRGWLDRLGQRYCQRWGAPLPGGKLNAPISSQGLLRWVAGLARETTRAEVAILNQGLLDAHWRPMRPDTLTGSDLHMALQYETPLRVARVTGRWLQTLAERGEANALLVQGLTDAAATDAAATDTLGNAGNAALGGGGAASSALLVNGRALEPDAHYRVVTSAFLAQGGDDALPVGPTWRAVRGAPLRAAALAELTLASAADPRDRLRNPKHVAEWRLGANLDGNFAGTQVNNDAGYSESQLDRDNTLSLGIDAGTRVFGLADRWRWENTMQLLYRVNRSGASDFDEGIDRSSWRSTFLLRKPTPRDRQIGVPEPFLENYLETELTQPSETEFHHLLFRPVVGLRFTLTRSLSISATGGFETEALDPDHDVLPGAGVQVTLSAWSVGDESTRRFVVEGIADYFVAALTPEVRQTLRSRVSTTLEFHRMLSLGLVFDVFGFQQGSDSFSLAFDAAVALRLRWLERFVRS